MTPVSKDCSIRSLGGLSRGECRSLVCLPCVPLRDHRRGGPRARPVTLIAPFEIVSTLAREATHLVDRPTRNIAPPRQLSGKTSEAGRRPISLDGPLLPAAQRLAPSIVRFLALCCSQVIGNPATSGDGCNETLGEWSNLRSKSTGSLSTTSRSRFILPEKPIQPRE